MARHKSHFFSEKDAAGHPVDCFAAVAGFLKLVPERTARAALAADYAGMLEDQILAGDGRPFAERISTFTEIAARSNAP